MRRGSDNASAYTSDAIGYAPGSTSLRRNAAIRVGKTLFRHVVTA
jgi:hypothetical protein